MVTFIPSMVGVGNTGLILLDGCSEAGVDVRSVPALTRTVGWSGYSVVWFCRWWGKTGLMFFDRSSWFRMWSFHRLRF